MKHLPLYPDTRAVIEKTEPLADCDSNCKRCKLHEGTRTVCMGADGQRPGPQGFEGAVLVLGDFPSEAEDASARPVSHGPNATARTIIEKLYDGPVVYANAVRCAPKSRTVSPSTVAKCSGYTLGLIQELKPARIVCLGRRAYQAVLGSDYDSVLLGRRGYGYLSDGTPVYMLHPARRVTANKFLLRAWKNDLEWALTGEPPERPPWEGVIKQIETAEDAEAAAVELALCGFTYDTETGGLMGDDYFQVVCLTATPHNDLNISYLWGEEALMDSALTDPLRKVLADSDVEKVGHNLKFDFEAVGYGLDLRDDAGVLQVKGVGGDTMLWARMLDTESKGALEYADHHVGMGGHKKENEQALNAAVELVKRARAEPRQRRLPGTTHPALKAALRHPAVNPKAFAYALVPRDVLYRYCALDTVATARLYAMNKPRVEAKPHWTLVTEECQLGPTQAVAQIEAWGMSADRGTAELFGHMLTPKRDAALSKIRALGCTADLGSPAQMAGYLYGDLSLPVQEVSEKTGQPKVNAASLEKLRDHHEIIPLILEHAKLQKLISTYVDGLIPHIRPDGRIRSSLNIAGARSGRMSCVAAWTPITTRRGVIPIRDVVVGDEVWTHRKRWRRVTHTIIKGVEQMYDVRLSNGAVMTCTAAHRLLTQAGAWRPVQEYLDVSVEEVGSEARERGEGAGAVPQPRVVDGFTTGRAHRNVLSQRTARFEDAHAGSGVRRVEGCAQVSVEDGVEEPDVWQGEGGSPQLEGALRQRRRVLHSPAQREAAAHAPCGDGGSVGGGGAARAFGRAPHRRGPGEQRAGQLSARHQEGASHDSLLASEGEQGVAVEAADPCGSLLVYDLTVEEDHSYEACGVFSHNSSDPNLQNIPSIGEFAKMAKSIFNAPPGHVLIQLDYSQLEVRIAAMLSQDPDLLQTYLDGVDVHRRTASRAFNIPEADVDKASRRNAKAVVFGVLYGKGPGSLAKDLGVSYEAGVAIYDAVLGVYATLTQWMKDQRAYTERHGITWTYIPQADGTMKRARMRQLWQIAEPDGGQQSRARNGAVNCLDAETEALTKRGWVKGFDLKMTDELLTKHPETGVLEWQHPTDLKFWPDYEGPLVEFKSRSFHAVSTPEHRWLVTDKASGKDVEKTSATLSRWGDHRIHRTGAYYGAAEATYSDEFVWLAGWFLTDGYKKQTRKVTHRPGKRGPKPGTPRSGVCQRKDPHRETIRRGLEALEAVGKIECLKETPHSQNPEMRYWEFRGEYSAQLWNLFPNRELTFDFLSKLTRGQLVDLLHTMLDGDGHREEGGKITFYSGSKAQADAFQALVTMTGGHARRFWRDTSKYTPTSSKMNNIPKSEGCWHVTLSNRAHVQVHHDHVREYEAKQPVWCPVVPNTFFVARRGEHVFVTGNTPVQGSASDFMLRTLVAVVEWIIRDGVPARVTNTVHDSIILEAPFAWALEVAGVVKDIMEAWPSCGVPLVADCDVGLTWGTLHKLEGVLLVGQGLRNGMTQDEILHVAKGDKDLAEEMGDKPADWFASVADLATKLSA